MILSFDGAVEGVEGLVPSIEVHIDLLPPDIRCWKSETINSMNMGGFISVIFPEEELPVIKVGEDKKILKMYAMNHDK